MIDCRIFVQARMSSKRFPGKVLAPLAGKPVIEHVLDRVARAVAKDRVALVTSSDKSDDPLESYVADRLGFAVFRGALENVAVRFSHALDAHPAEWFVRISGDSPAIDPGLITWMMRHASPDVDLITNVAVRTFPPGQSVEIVRSSVFVRLADSDLSADEREHVTLRFYNRREEYRIRSVTASDRSIASRRFVVDTLRDLEMLEAIFVTDPGLLSGYARHAQLADR